MWRFELRLPVFFVWRPMIISALMAAIARYAIAIMLMMTFIVVVVVVVVVRFS